MSLHKILLICLVLILSKQTAHSQKIYSCDSTHSYWGIEKNGSFFAVKIEGMARNSERKSLITVNRYMLQYVVVDKSNYIESAEDTGLIPLIKYAQSEGGYISKQFHAKLSLNMLKAPVEGQKILIWSFDMPTGISETVKAQIFVNVVIGDKIFGLSSSQFSDSIGIQSFEELQDFLVKVISTVRQLKSSEEFDKLCK